MYLPDVLAVSYYEVPWNLVINIFFWKEALRVIQDYWNNVSIQSYMKPISLYALSPHLVKISVNDQCKPAYYDCTTVYSILSDWVFPCLDDIFSRYFSKLALENYCIIILIKLDSKNQFNSMFFRYLLQWMLSYKSASIQRMDSKLTFPRYFT